MLKALLITILCFFVQNPVQATTKERRPNMSLTITYPRTHEGWSGGGDFSGSGGASATRDVSAKMLVEDEGGNLVPCNYQYWHWGDEHGMGSGNYYIPSGEQPVNPGDLNVVKRETFESGSSEGEGFPDFIRNLMHNPPTGVQFIGYDGVEKVTSPQEYWNFFGVDIPKWVHRTRFVHRFSLYGLQTPLDKEYEARIAEKKQQVVERKSNLERLERELSPLSLSEYLNGLGQKVNAFNTVPIEHSEENTIGSGYSLPSIDGLVSLAGKNFVRKAPNRTVGIVAVQKEIIEIPSSFFVQGKQRVTYRGFALVRR